MSSQDTIQQLALARIKLFEDAWESRDVEALTSLQSQDVQFSDFLTAKLNLDYSGLLAYNTKQCADFSAFKFSKTKLLSAGRDHATYECVFDSTAAKDIPEIGMTAGDAVGVFGVFHFLYRWEGPGEGWDGTISDETVKAWKIVEQKDIFVPVGGTWKFK